MVNEMSLRLEKLVEDIKEETILWPIEDAKNSPEEEAAWSRIGAKHKMTGPHVKSIFKVLTKKYEVEKANPNTEWKLFSYLSFLDKKKEENIDDTDFDGEDGEEFVELLEVNEDYCSDDEEINTSGGSTSEHSSKNTSAEQHQTNQISQDIHIRKIKSDSRINTERKDSKNGALKKVPPENGIKMNTNTAAIQIKTTEQRLRKSTSPVPRKVGRIPLTLPKNNNGGIQEKEKKTQSTLTAGLKLALKKDEKPKQPLPNLKEVKLKRKNEIKNNDKDEDELNSPPIKRQIVLPKGIRVIPPSAKSTTSKTTASTVPVETRQQSKQGTSNINASSNFMPISPTDKLPPFSSLFKKSPTSGSKEQENKIASEIKVQNQKQENEQQKRSISPENLLETIKTEIASPDHSASNTIVSINKMNGIDTIRKDYSDKGEAKLEIEQICKDADENTEIKVKVLTEQAEKILPTFFRDLYNSKKYDSFGMYVSSTMNRLPSYLASKLEAKILQSIIEINAMVDERMEEM